MDKGPLVKEEIEAGAELVREFNKFMPVKAACWLKSSETGRWHLYIATDEVNGGSTLRGYGEIVRLTHAKRNFYLDSQRVKLIGSETPIARAVRDIQELYPGPTPIRYNEMFFGDTNVDEAYLYPLPETVSSPAG